MRRPRKRVSLLIIAAMPFNPVLPRHCGFFICLLFGSENIVFGSWERIGSKSHHTAPNYTAGRVTLSWLTVAKAPVNTPVRSNGDLGAFGQSISLHPHGSNTAGGQLSIGSGLALPLKSITHPVPTSLAKSRFSHSSISDVSIFAWQSETSDER